MPCYTAACLRYATIDDGCTAAARRTASAGSQPALLFLHTDDIDCIAAARRR